MISSKKPNKSVTLIVPCLNEADYIGLCIESVINNGYPLKLINILIIDGMSTDNTRGIVSEYIEKYRFIDLINNPGANKARALNIGIDLSCSDVVMRLDAHATYDKHYISNCINALYKYDVVSVGGVRKNLPRNGDVISKTLAYLLSNPFAVGNAHYNTGVDKPKEVDILFLFCIKKSDLERIGVFNEKLIRGQDRDYNMRIHRGGGKLLLIPSAVSFYYARNKIIQFIKWAYIGGQTPIYISRLTEKNLLSLRNFVPSIFLVVLLSLLMLSFINRLFLFPLVSVIGMYLSASFMYSINIVRKERSLLYFLSMPLSFLSYHLSYGAGFIMGIFKKVKD